MKRTFLTLLAFAILLAIAWGAYVVLHWGWNELQSFSKEIKVALVAVTVGPIVSVAVLAFSKYLEREHTKAEQIRTKKTEAYEKLLEVWFRFFSPSAQVADNDKQSKSELTEALNTATKLLLVWGSDEIVSRWSRFRRTMGKSGIAQTFADMESLLHAIRKDIGMSNKKLTHMDAVGTFINDIPVPGFSPEQMSTSTQTNGGGSPASPPTPEAAVNSSAVPESSTRL